MDLAARSTPKGCEGLGYSLFLIFSIRNVALSGADIVGSYLADQKMAIRTPGLLKCGNHGACLVLLPFSSSGVDAKQRCRSEYNRARGHIDNNHKVETLLHCMLKRIGQKSTTSGPPVKPEALLLKS